MVDGQMSTDAGVRGSMLSAPAVPIRGGLRASHPLGVTAGAGNVGQAGVELAAHPAVPFAHHETVSASTQPAPRIEQVETRPVEWLTI